MRQVYNRSFTVTFSTGDSGYVFAERIDPGYILHVHSALAYAPEREASDDIIIGVRNGGQDVIIRTGATLATQRGLEAQTNFFVGEGDQAFAYFPDADNGDSLGIHLNGVLLPLKDWEKGME